MLLRRIWNHSENTLLAVTCWHSCPEVKNDDPHVLQGHTRVQGLIPEVALFDFSPVVAPSTCLATNVRTLREKFYSLAGKRRLHATHWNQFGSFHFGINKHILFFFFSFPRRSATVFDKCRWHQIVIIKIHSQKCEKNSFQMLVKAKAFRRSHSAVLPIGHADQE